MEHKTITLSKPMPRAFNSKFNGSDIREMQIIESGPYLALFVCVPAEFAPDLSQKYSYFGVIEKSALGGHANLKGLEFILIGEDTSEDPDKMTIRDRSKREILSSAQDKLISLKNCGNESILFCRIDVPDPTKITTRVKRRYDFYYDSYNTLYNSAISAQLLPERERAEKINTFLGHAQRKIQSIAKCRNLYSTIISCVINMNNHYDSLLNFENKKFVLNKDAERCHNLATNAQNNNHKDSYELFHFYANNYDKKINEIMCIVQKITQEINQEYSRLISAINSSAAAIIEYANMNYALVCFSGKLLKPGTV